MEGVWRRVRAVDVVPSSWRGGVCLVDGFTAFSIVETDGVLRRLGIGASVAVVV